MIPKPNSIIDFLSGHLKSPSHLLISPPSYRYYMLKRALQVGILGSKF